MPKSVQPIYEVITNTVPLFDDQHRKLGVYATNFSADKSRQALVEEFFDSDPAVTKFTMRVLRSRSEIKEALVALDSKSHSTDNIGFDAAYFRAGQN